MRLFHPGIISLILLPLLWFGEEGHQDFAEPLMKNGCRKLGGNRIFLSRGVKPKDENQRKRRYRAYAIDFEMFLLFGKHELVTTSSPDLDICIDTTKQAGEFPWKTEVLRPRHSSSPLFTSPLKRQKA